ncbi:hypothetical protein A4X13_0g4258, partial [Tilletia indica]
DKLLWTLRLNLNLKNRSSKEG